MSNVRWNYAPWNQPRATELQLFAPPPHPLLAAAIDTSDVPGPAAKWSWRLALIVLSILIITSCASLGPASEAPASVDRARSLDRAGDFAGAARV
jgi:hypothetical protein